MDTDKNPRVSKRYKVNSIPAIFAFKEGKPVDKSIGVIPKRALVKFINDAFD
jgi:thioredoxin-like negative regulator of GroEL